MTLPTFEQQLQQLVATPSVSCTSPQWDMGNMGVINLLASWLEELGFSCQVLPVPGHDNKANLIAVLGSEKEGSGAGGLVLSGHTDTVPYDEDRWQQDPFTLTEKNKRYYGLGATDMKGFFPVAIAAASAFAADKEKLKHPIIILATADEESSMSGARALAEMDTQQLSESGLAQPRFAVIGEPTGMRPIRMHKGIMMEAVHVEGRAGHSSNPALGNNALESMHLVLGELLKYRKELQARYQNPGFEVQVPTLNLGCIHGGDNPNRICGSCELHFDLRPLPGMDNAQLHHDIEQRLQPLAEKSGSNIILSTLFGGVAPFEEDANSALIQACEKLTGQDSNSVAFATEAPFLQQLGMQTVVMGPGSIDQAHQPDEFIELNQLQPAIDTLKGLIRQFCL